MQTIQKISDLELRVLAKDKQFDVVTLEEKTPILIDYEIEPGQKEILNDLPENCQPGWPIQAVINGIKNMNSVLFEGTYVMLLIKAGTDITEIVSAKTIEYLEEKISEELKNG